MHNERPIYQLIAELAESLGRNPDDFTDAYACGEGIAVINNGRLQAFAFAHVLTTTDLTPKGVGRRLRNVRVINFIWSDPSLDVVAAPIMRRETLEELMKRLKDCVVLLTEAVATNLEKTLNSIPFTELPRVIRFRAMRSIGIPHISPSDREHALAQRVACVIPTISATSP